MDLRQSGCARVACIPPNSRLPVPLAQPEDIRKTFNIKNDFTPEEEALVREENKVSGSARHCVNPAYPASAITKTPNPPSRPHSFP